MKIEVFLYWVVDDFSEDGGRYCMLNSGNMSGHENRWSLLGSKEVDFDIPAFDARAKAVESLVAQKDSVIKEATAKAQAIEEKIQQLLALDAPVAA